MIGERLILPNGFIGQVVFEYTSPSHGKMIHVRHGDVEFRNIPRSQTKYLKESMMTKEELKQVKSKEELNLLLIPFGKSFTATELKKVGREDVENVILDVYKDAHPKSPSKKNKSKSNTKKEQPDIDKAIIESEGTEIIVIIFQDDRNPLAVEIPDGLLEFRVAYGIAYRPLRYWMSKNGYSGKDLKGWRRTLLKSEFDEE